MSKTNKISKKKNKNKNKNKNRNPINKPIKRDIQHNHSRIQRELPIEIINKIHDMLIQGNATYDEVKQFLSGEKVILKKIEYQLPDEQTYDISRSAIGRYGKRFFELFKDFMIIQQQAKMMVNESADCLFMEEAVSRLSITKLFQLLMDKNLSANQISSILTSISRIQSAAVEREKFKQTITKKIHSVKETKGLSDDAVNAIESIIMGE